jgi:hypothetical protein
MSWVKKTFGSVEYDLSHLDSFTMDVSPKSEPGKVYKVRVTFTCHTFTREWLQGDLDDYRHIEGTEIRTFCADRYAHSRYLRSLIEHAAGGKVRFNNQTPFVIPATIPGLSGPYAIYFNAFKASTKGLDVIIDVRSAHHKPNLNMNLPKITFATLVGQTAAGRPVKAPKK